MCAFTSHLHLDVQIGVREELDYGLHAPAGQDGHLVGPVLEARVRQQLKREVEELVVGGA